MLTRSLVVLQAIAGGVTDILLMITPIPTVLRLQMSRKAKAAVMAWFGVGIITLAMSIMRLISLLSQLSSSDTPWNMPDAMLWLYAHSQLSPTISSERKLTNIPDRIVESNLVILCGCLPTLRIFIKHMLPEIVKSTTASSSAKSSGKGFDFRTFGQSTRARRHFDTLAEIDAIDDIPLNDDTADYKVTINRHIRENPSRDGSEELIIGQTTSIVQTSGFLPSRPTILQEVGQGLAWVEMSLPEVSNKRA